MPSIDGLWTIPTESSKGESAWRFIVKQSGANVSAAILRVDGDTGSVQRIVQGWQVRARSLLGRAAAAARSDASRRRLADHRPERASTKMVAVRESEARAKNMPELTDPSKHTRMKDPTARFTFSFPDLNGRIVTEADPKFKGKVVMVSIGGSWCPNCHDEAPFLGELHEMHRAQGLEIVLLSFEEVAPVRRSSPD